MVDENGNIVNRYSYDEWGNILEKQETIENPIRYAGEYYDEESGLYYLRARYYDPVIGRFITKDSYEGQLTNPLSLNLYTYCYNNPLAYIDPSGHEPSKDYVTGIEEDVEKAGKLYNFYRDRYIKTMTSKPMGYDGETPVYMSPEEAGAAFDIFFVELGAGVAQTGVKGATALKQMITTASKDIKVIGRLDDTAVARNWKGHDVLNDPNWTLRKNDAWVNSGIKNKQDFYIASPMIEKNLISSNPKYPGDTVFAREIRMLQEAGYIQKGDYFIHPNNLK